MEQKSAETMYDQSHFTPQAEAGTSFGRLLQQNYDGVNETDFGNRFIDGSCTVYVLLFMFKKRSVSEIVFAYYFPS